MQTFLEGEENQNTERKTKSYVMSGFGNVFLTTENKKSTDLPQADFGHFPERFLLSIRTKSITKNFVY